MAKPNAKSSNRASMRSALARRKTLRASRLVEVCGDAKPSIKRDNGAVFITYPSSKKPSSFRRIELSIGSRVEPAMKRLLEGKSR